MDIKEQKKKLREKIWKLLQEKNVARFPFPIEDRIPNFEGSEKAANLLQQLKEWKNAKIIVTNPDFAQKKVRELVLKNNKTLIMASPRLKKGYLEIKNVKGKEEFASTIAGAFKYGKKLDEMPKPDLIVTGCVAVDKNGWRLGKGGGYGDKEISRVTEKFGRTLIITTVHDLQIVEEVPHEKYDTKVDYILTPTTIIKCARSSEPFQGYHDLKYRYIYK